MATIITKNSSTPSSVPTAGDLVQGELAVNVADKRLFTEDSTGSVVELGTNPSSLTTSTVDIDGGNIDGVTIATSDVTVGSGKTLDVSAGTLTLANDQISGDAIDGGTATPTTVTSTTVNATTVDSTNIEVTNLKAKDGTSAGSIADSTGVVTLASSVLTTTDINGGSVDAVTLGTNSAVTEAQVDNINIDGNTISSTDTNGNVTITPDGTGSVVISKVDVADGEIDGTAIGANSASTGSFTTLNATGGGALTGTWTDLGTVTTVDINGGTIDDSVIGGATPAAGTFTTLNATGGGALTGTWTDLGSVTTVDINGGTIDGTTQASGTINGPIAAGGTWTAAATWTLPALTLGGTVTSNGQSFSGTIADLGTVTTVDINGGTIDNTVIGATTPAAATVTTLTATGGISALNATLSSTFPALIFNDTDAGTDEKRAQFINSNGNIALRTRTDADGPGSNILLVARTGTAIDSITYGNSTDSPTHTFEGNVELSALDVFQQATGSVNFTSTPTPGGADGLIHNANNATAYYQWNINGSQALTVNSTGLGVGTAPSVGKLQVAGGRSFFGANSELFSVGFGYTNSRVNSGQVFYIGATDSATPDLVLSNAAGTEQLRVSNSSGLSLDGGSNYLDTYEEGTFTPVLQFGGATTNITYTTQTGTYVRVGDLCFVCIDITLSNKGTATGIASIAGLPFTSFSSGRVTGSFYAVSITSTGTPIYQLSASNTSFTLESIADSGAPASLDDTDFVNTSSPRISFCYRVA